MAWLSIERVIITQGNAHPRDNANLLACLGKMGALARGVAVIDGGTGDAEMQRLTAAGIVGARIMDLPGGGGARDRITWPHNQAQTTSYPDHALLLDRVLSWLPYDRARELALVNNPEELFRWATADARIFNSGLFSFST